MSAYEKYKELWIKKTKRQVEKEIESMRKYIQKHASSYAFHGNQTNPEEMTDGQRLSALKEVLEIKTID